MHRFWFSHLIVILSFHLCFFFIVIFYNVIIWNMNLEENKIPYKIFLKVYIFLLEIYLFIFGPATYIHV
jgi:hypothetical protein